MKNYEPKCKLLSKLVHSSVLINSRPDPELFQWMGGCKAT